MEKRESIQLQNGVRIENGPVLVRAVTTWELLDDGVTQSHYKIGMLDALGKKIVLGEEMAYLDYFAPYIWFVFDIDSIGIDANGRPVGVDESGVKIDSPSAVRFEDRYVVIGKFNDKETAIAFGEKVRN